MKNRFSGYFTLSKKEYDDLWKGSVISLDANVLLNLYRYSELTRDGLIGLLKSLKDRLWISHQAAYEYLENRLEEISHQEKAYDDMINKFDEIVELFEDRRKHPFISQVLLRRLTKTHDAVKKELEANKKEHTERYSHDSVQDELIALFDGKVGPAYSKEQLKEIYKLGDERYKAKTPPGYKDEGKSGAPGSNYRMYGDYIIWKQLIDKALKDKVDIIYVTDERKEDWWRKFKGKTIGPRPELVQEFMELTGRRFHMYKVDSFMEYGAKKFERPVTEETIKEIRGISNESAARLANISDLDVRTYVVPNTSLTPSYPGYTLANASPVVIASGKPIQLVNSSGQPIQVTNASGQPIQFTNVSGGPAQWVNPLLENIWSVAAVPNPQDANEQPEGDIDSQIKKKREELDYLKSRKDAERQNSEGKEEKKE